MMMQEDYGNLGNLISFLNGKDSLEDRLEIALRLFFTPLSLPPQHKEEVVILWMENILSTNKILTYTMGERELCWKTMRKLLTSQRLQALCLHNWVCSLAAFFQTLVDTVYELATPSSIRKQAFLICEHFLNFPHLSPQASHLAMESVSLCKSFLVWINPSDFCPKFCSFMSLLLQKVAFISKHHLEPTEAIFNIYDILLPLLKIANHLHADPDVEVRNMLHEINMFVNNLVCHKNFAETHAEILSFPFLNDTSLSLTNERISYFSFITNCITDANKDVATYLLKPYIYCFFNNSNSNAKTCYELFVCLMHLLGVSLVECLIIDSQVFISYTDKIKQLPKDTINQYILLIMQTLINSNISLRVSLKGLKLRQFITKVGFYLLNEVSLTEHSIKCLSIIGKSNHRFFIKAPNLFYKLLFCCKKETGTCKAMDNLLCEIFDTYKKLRIPHKLYVQLCLEILALTPQDISDTIYLEPWTNSEGKHLLPMNFVKKLVICIAKMGPHLWFHLADEMTKLLSDQCLKILRQNDYTAHVSSVLWLTSICLSAAPLMDIAFMSGMSSQVCATMNTFAQAGLLPLVSELIKINKGVSFIASSLVDVILVWSEFHMTLLSAGIGYKEKTLFPMRPILSSTSSRDFSAQAPFLDSEMWNKFLSTCFSDDIFGVSIIQLLIQKVTLIALHSTDCKVLDSKFDLSASKASIQACLDDIFAIYKNVPDSRFTNVIADHLPSLAPFLSQSHWTRVAEMFISGFEEDRLVWKELGQSAFFKECNQLHFSCYYQLCQRIFLLLAQKKRKHNEKELDKIEPKGNYTNLTRMVLKHAIKLHDHPCEDNFEQCFISINALLKCRYLEPSILFTERSQEVVLSLHILELYPLGCVSQNLTLGLISYLLVVLIGEGGMNGRQAVVSQLLHILNLVVSSPFTANMFVYFKQPYIIFSWFLDQSEEILKNSIEDEHLKIIIDEEGPNAQSPTKSMSFVGQLISLMTTWINSFIDSSKDGHYVLEFISVLAKKKDDDDNMKEESILFAVIISSHIRKKIMKSFKISPTLMNILQALYQWCLVMSQTVNLADITIVTLAFFLTVLDSLLFAAAKMKSKKLTPVKKKRRGDQSPSEVSFQNDPLENVEWKSLFSYGVQVIPLVAETGNPCLKKLCFNFATGVANSSPAVGAIDAISHFKMALSLISGKDDPSSNPTFLSALSNVPLKGYKKLVASLLQDLQSGSLESQILFQWRAIVNTPPPLHSVIAKGEAIDQLISILCLQIACQSEASQGAPLDLTLSLLHAALTPKNCTLSTQSKALVINVFPKVMSHIQLATLPQFSKVFECCADLFQSFLKNEYYFMYKRPSAILSTFTTLVCALLHRANESKQTSLNEDLKALEKISEHLHAITFLIGSFDTILTKVVPFYIATIVHKIQLSEVPPSVKDSVERIVYFLLDISDEKSLRHVMFNFPYSITALIKHYHSTYKTNFKFISKVT